MIHKAMLTMGRSTWPSGTWGAGAGPAAAPVPAAVRAAAPTCSPLAAPRSWTQGTGERTDVAAGAWACCAGPAFQRDSHRCRRASSRRAICAHTLTPMWLRGNCTVMGLLCLVHGVVVGCGHSGGTMARWESPILGCWLSFQLCVSDEQGEQWASILEV